MATRTINGWEVEIDGKGPAVLMVHGLGGTSNTFVPQVQALAGRFRVVRPDLPNAGRSGVMPAASLRELAGGLQQVMEALGVDDVHLLGHSLGSLVCQYLAEAWPTRVRSMVLLGPLQEPADAARQALRQRAGVARTEGMAGIADTIVELGLAQETRATQPAAVAFVRESVMRQPAEGYARLCEALADARQAALTLIACPVLLITGDQDRTAPVAAASALRAALPDARLSVIPACGHWAGVEHPHAVNMLLENFMTR